MDLTIFQFINNLAGRWYWLDEAGIFLATYVGLLLVAYLGYLFYFPPKNWRTRLTDGGKKEMRRMVWVSAISAIVARGVVVELIRFFYHRPRPISVDAVHHLVMNTEWSFPSGHASFFFALSTGVYLYNKKLGIIFYLVSLLMGIARIFIGVHWPSDILGGILLGIVTALIVQKISERYFLVPRERVELS